MPTGKEIKIVDTKPPIFDNAQAAFQCDLSKMIFTYGDIIHNLTGHELPPNIIAHESVHIKQQTEMGAELWWGKFLRNPVFRIDQEARAYGKQLIYIYTSTKNGRDRNYIHRVAHDLAMSLSGPIYGNAIELHEAIRLIKHYASV